ncbi:type II glyceraldehyde-3-phosphate dehydrogenase [Rhodohalobacter sp. SW132]|uniref:type II glyceraldehyde-3-phosphate dehydrogenase n=1 Tax=Rhodohalobacter sp. SW132 TaxID=2293433 RepID=UPI000E23837E|nr:type II glyceraldehyde-3-phosphate dehydrogenase [Rhodohalobacter sp. SW132]REL38999.1 type II glyceraldehyde-3-phosphate dehydrogenase [Rhodohalobacter sp. SW132]
MKKINVAVNGYGVIGKRIAEALDLQDDMELIGIGDVAADWRIKVAAQKYSVFANTEEGRNAMAQENIQVAGDLDDLLDGADVVVDCAPKKFGAQNAEKYRQAGVKFIVQGGEKHQTTGHSFTAESNYTSALGRESTRIVSCNTTSIVRTLSTLKRADLLEKARGTLLRRATDPWESHKNGIMNTMVPEPEIPSHQGPDAQSVDPDLDVVTAAVKVPQTLSHLHYWTVQLTREASKEEVLEAFASSTRTAFIKMSDELSANNAVKELMLDLGRPHGDMYEVAIWEDMLKVEGDELYYAYLVDNQAIVIPETIDAIRALTEAESDPKKSIERTNQSLGVRQRFV